jgi:apolipoprotein N-acyltransferase
MPERVWIPLAGVTGSALLLWLYAQGGALWPLGFVMLLPWLLSQERAQGLGAALLSGLLMSLGMVLAAFAWFAPAIASYTGGSPALALLLLALAAPLLQPQLLVFALLRQLLWRQGRWLAVLAAAAGWTGCEWLLPKLFGDSLGHGLHPSLLLRQGADLFGVAGLSLALILCNEALAAAWAQRQNGARRVSLALLPALLLPLMLAAYGQLRLQSLHAHAATQGDAPSLRLGLVQSNIVDYEGLRERIGTYAVVRQVLDTHYALSRQAIAEHGAEALLWSETIYPTPFGSPRSEDGAALDAEIVDFVRTSGRSLAFGTYDVDSGGEYNAAAFVDPLRGPLGHYRKTHPFPLTEYVPDWLEGPALRRWLPWAGTWQRGHGPRVMPLRVADGRELNVLPLICLDAVRPQLALDGARLGAQAIVGLSNDAWFSQAPQGARLHLQVAAFRSVETRLPQLRATPNGISAHIDARGEIIAQTAMNEAAVLVADFAIAEPAPSLMRAWGDWLGPVCLFGLGLLGLIGLARAARRQFAARNARRPRRERPLQLSLLSTPWRVLIAALRVLAALGLLALLLRMLLRDGLQVQSLGQIQLYVGAVLAPLCAAWLFAKAFATRVRIEGTQLLLVQRGRRIEIPLAALQQVRAWRLPLPGPGLQLQLSDASLALAGSDSPRLHEALQARRPLASAESTHADATSTAAEHPAGRAASANDTAKANGNAGASRWQRLLDARAQARLAWLDHGLIRFGLFPLLAALPAFRLHQIIAYGGPLGELYTFGAQAWLSGLLIWWASWSLGLMLFAAGLRALIEALALALAALQPARIGAARASLEWLGRGLYFLGVPSWLLLRLLAS